MCFAISTACKKLPGAKCNNVSLGYYDLQMPKVQTSTGVRSVAFYGPTMWNGLLPALCYDSLSLILSKKKIENAFYKQHQRRIPSYDFGAIYRMSSPTSH